MNPNDDSKGKITSNRSMDANLTNRVDEILHNLATEDLLEGLGQVSVRLGELFSASSEELKPEQLLKFCVAYIQLTPSHAAVMNQAAQTLNLQVIITHYTELSTRYLASACSELENSDAKPAMETFLILLQGAYIFARMQEELDDKVQAFVGVPVGDLDLMDANLIAHEIVGDQFANRLDKVIATLIQQSKVSKSLIEANLDKTLITQSREQGHSLSGGRVKSFADQFGLSLISGLLS